MNTPICDFVREYATNNPVRMHMPGHKGQNVLGFEALDITEIGDADDLYHPTGIVRYSEENASKLFGCPTYYSTEGSSQCIRAMLYLCLLKANDDKNTSSTVIAGRNAHQTFETACALLDLDVEWLYGSEKSTYLSLDLTSEDVRAALIKMSENNEKPICVYLTSPDYLGNIADVKNISNVCHEFNVPLAIDNAHGAYLKFLPDGSIHPIDLGADICCDSAHKTLPVVTGGAYLHLSSKMNEEMGYYVKKAMAMFGSTSPSWLILQSLDKCNELVDEACWKEGLKRSINDLKILAERINSLGIRARLSEPLKLVIQPNEYGYEGDELAQILRANGVECEFADISNIVLMATPMNDSADFKKVHDVFETLPKKCPKCVSYPKISAPQKAMSIRETSMRMGHKVPVDSALGKVSAFNKTSCPPAVPIIMSGEVIDENTIRSLKAFGFETIEII